jgi:hypothetical protein
LESGTDRNWVSAAVSAAALRKPKIVVAPLGEADAFPPDDVGELKRMAEERSAAKRTLMGSDVKVSKVAQVPAPVGKGILTDI